MSQMMFMVMSMINSMAFTAMSHPMNMGILLLIQVLLTCMITGSMGMSLWFSYILFLVFLGGILVLFIYMTSIASNEMFQKSNYPMLIPATTLASAIMVMMFLFAGPSFASNNTHESMIMQTSWSTEKSSVLAMMFNSPNSSMTIFMVIYLLLALIVVVNITETHLGPLRSKL